MESSNNGGGEAPTGYLSLPNETCVSGNELHLIELLASWDNPNNPGYCQGY